jgi:hypothetical protein
MGLRYKKKKKNKKGHGKPLNSVGSVSFHVVGEFYRTLGDIVKERVNEQINTST